MKKYFLTLVILCVVSLQLSAVSVPQWITAFENQNRKDSEGKNFTARFRLA